MAISRVQPAGTNHASGTTPLAASLGSAATSGNLLVAFVGAATSTGTINPPAGWTAGPKSNGQTGDQVSAFWKVSNGTEGTSFSFSEVGGNLIFVIVLELTGVDTTNPNDATGVTNSGALGGVNGMVMTVPAQVTTGSMIVGAGYQLASATPISGFATMTSDANVTDGFPKAIFVGEELSDTTSNRTGTSDAGGGWETVALRLRPAASASVVLPTAPRPRAFQEQGRIYSGEITGFQPLAFQIPDPGRAFQENDGFQPQAFQLPDPSVAFQPEAFDGFTSFQMSVLAFQEPTGFQGDAFQEYAGLPRSTPRTIIVSNNGVDESRDRFLRARQHRQARILRAPVQAPAAPTVVKQSITVVGDRRAARARTRRRRPILLRAPLVATPPRKPVIETRTLERTRVVARLRRRKPQILHAPLAALPAKAQVGVHLRKAPARARLRRRKPLLLHAPVAAPPSVNRVQVHGRTRPKRLRQRKPIILRGVSIPTPPPATGIPVKRIFVSEDRRSAFVKAKRRARIILKAPSVPTPVPLVRVNVKVVQRKRTALVARLRHDQAIIRRAPVAAVRAPKQIVVRRQRRLQKKRTRATILRSAPLWQRPGYAKITVAKRKRQPLVARARRKLRYLASHVYGPPPPPATDSGFGLVFISDVPIYQGSVSDVAVHQVGIADASGYALAFVDGSLYRVSIDDLNAGGSVALSDIPGH